MFTVRRSSHNPLLSPRKENPWESLATFHPSIARDKDGYVLFYRAVSSPDRLRSPQIPLSSIGLAHSEDGSHFHTRSQVVAPRESFDEFGCEDPRATFFEGKWYVFYTALGGFPFNASNIKVAVAFGDTPGELTERRLITPFNAKAAALFPERIEGDVALLLTVHTDYTPENPRPTIAIARAKEIEDFFDPGYWKTWYEALATHALPDLRRSDEDHVEVGAAPVKTERGWLLIYSYIQHYYDESRRIFGIEAALLKADEPQRILARNYPFLVPEETYERYGLVPNIAFPASAIVEDGRLDLYYSAADTTCVRASINLNDLLDTLDKTAEPAFVRAKNNPIISPDPAHSFESRATFNAAAFLLDDSVHILYRAMDAMNTSTIGYARSKDGITIDERLPEPIYVPREDFELKNGKPDGNSGCEDPRTVVIDDTLYMTYTAYDGVRAPRGAITSISVEDFRARRFEKWTKPLLVTPDEVDDKDLSLLPERLKGNYLVYHRIDGRVCADLLEDLSSGKRVSRCIEVMGPREGMWDAAKVGIAAPPIKVEGGWLMFYHGVSRRSRYRVGAMLVDESGTTVIARSADPLFEPSEDYEKEGEIGNVVFPCGIVVRGDTVFMYYGGGDKVLGVATGSLSRILSALSCN